MKNVISDRTLERLPLYCNYLRLKIKEDCKTISSVQIANDMRLKPIQVRKDISNTGMIGKPKIGYNVHQLLTHLIEFLGWNKIHNAVLIGCGSLGQSLLKYVEFDRYGLNIIAGFDNNSDIVDSKINGKQIYHIDQLEVFLVDNNVEIAIISVDETKAQIIADRLVKNNIKAIWNFAPIALLLPEDVLVQQQDMTPCISFLTKKMQNKKECFNKNK